MAATYLCAQADCENKFEICKRIKWNTHMNCSEECADINRRYDEKHPNMSCSVCEKKVTVRFDPLKMSGSVCDTFKKQASAPHSLSYNRQNWTMSKFFCSPWVLRWVRFVSRSSAEFLVRFHLVC